MKVLIVEDEKEILDTVFEYLNLQGFRCEITESFDGALEKIHLYDYDCVLLDLNLPTGSGFDLIKALKKQRKDTGIVIISARNKVEDRILGLELGADDFLVKPFDLAELSARVKSVVRRVRFQGSNIIEQGCLQIQTEERQVLANGEVLELTKKEFDMLLFFISNKERVVTKETIAEHLWGDYIDDADSFSFVYAHIKNLRKKLIKYTVVDYIQNVYGVGYKFVAE